MTKNEFTLSQAVAFCAFYVAGGDGDIPESELNVLKNDPFFKKYNILDHVDMFTDVLNGEPGLNEIMSEHFPKVFESCDNAFKTSYVNAIIRIIIADGEIEESELTLLNFTSGLMGLSAKDVTTIIEDENKRLSSQNQAQSTSKSEGCFIATATMGDYNNPVVVDFRKFRDTSLKSFVVGRIFIKVYYLLAPIPAAIIARHAFLRKLSLKYLINPLHKLIK